MYDVSTAASSMQSRHWNCSVVCSYIPETSLSRPPWPELTPYDHEKEEQEHQGMAPPFLSYHAEIPNTDSSACVINRRQITGGDISDGAGH